MPDLSTLPPAYFDAVYAAHADPWQFASSPYERDKYEATLAALPKPVYDTGFEIGCSIGVLTALLAPRCERLLAVDVSQAALDQARTRLADQSNVSLRRMQLPNEAPDPDNRFDLVLLSEVGYYWSVNDLTRVQTILLDRLLPGGHLLLVHWTPPVPDYPQTGDQVHEQFMARCGPGQLLTHLLHQRQSTYRLDLFVKD